MRPRSARRRSSSRTRATTRPRQCCCRCCGARPAPGWRAWRRVAGSSAGRCSRSRRRGNPRALRAPAAHAGARPHERRAAPPARVAAARDHPPARRRHRSRSRRGARAPGRAAARRRRGARRARRRDTMPTMSSRCARCRARWPGGSIRRWLAAPAPPSVATVDRVLAVARGEARAVELPGGDRIERVRGRLVRVAGVGQRVAPTGRARAPGPRPFRRRRDRGLDRERTARGVARRRGRAVVRRRPGSRPVVVRAPAPGERFRPLGRGGSKLLRDALAEAGVAASRRAVAAPVVAAAGAGVGRRLPYRPSRPGHDRYPALPLAERGAR